MPVQSKRPVRCAVYTRRSVASGLDDDLNSLEVQREICSAYIRSQRHRGWTQMAQDYDDGGYSGGNLNRRALSDCSPRSSKASLTSSSSTSSTG